MNEIISRWLSILALIAIIVFGVIFIATINRIDGDIREVNKNIVIESEKGDIELKDVVGQNYQAIKQIITLINEKVLPISDIVPDTNID